ncbi:MAG: hypothetical protein IIY21_13095 [Clostridiales bacterium]|nr:hypothetical protein [Clostridiales bacterium]
MPTSRFTSTVKLYKVDEIQKGHLLAFSSAANQTAFFESRKQQEIPNCKIIRNAPTIRVNIPKSDIYDVNYVSFVNPDYGDKVFYCIVIGAPLYVNDQCTELKISEDPIQTWMFDVDMDADETYIEREMLSQEKADIAADNPYDDALWEFDTPEALPVSPELEMRMYDFDSYATDSSADRASIYDKTAAKLFKTQGHDNLRNIIYVSPINWDSYDKAWENDPEHDPLGLKPSEQWEDYLEKASDNTVPANGTGNFVVQPDGTVLINGVDSGKTLTNKYPTLCYIIVTGNRYREKIIDFLTGLNLVSTIVNCIEAPQNLIDYSIKDQGATVDSYIPFEPVDMSSYHNKKLARFPFSYIRLITPAGDTAEFKYELFERLRNGDNIYEFGVWSDIIDGLKIYATPRAYQCNGLVNETSYSSINPQVAVNFGQFPTAPLSIDAFLAQMSATAAQLRSSATVTRNMQFASDLNQLSMTTNPLYNAAEAIGTVGGAYANMASSVMGGLDFEKGTGVGIDPANAAVKVATQSVGVINAALAQGKRGADKEILEHQAEVIRNAKSFLVSADNKGAFSQEYSASRVAYAADKYIPPKGPGFEHYADFGWLNMGIMKVTLRAEILERYDTYFNSYGFASGRAGGVPYVLKFIQGSNSDSELPEWINNQTFCKTFECHVIAPYQYVSEVWETAFNSGIHWINGDNLIQGAA